MSKKRPLLQVEGLSISSQERLLLNGLSFSVNTDEIVAIVGESGSGKSLTALSIAGLLFQTPLVVSSQKMQLSGQELSHLSHKDWQSVRGEDLGMVFQEPQSSLNPSMRCGVQVMERLEKNKIGKAQLFRAQVLEAFAQVQLPEPERIFRAYPHELSGGQKQRVMIAMALIGSPKLLIADEPTTALDVTVQKEILTLIKALQKANKMSVLFISHDLSVVAQFADRVLVMHQGKLVEKGTVEEIFKNPKDPYTQGLLYARPQPDKRLKRLPTVADFSNDSRSFPSVTKSTRTKKHKALYAQKPLLEVKGLVKEYPLTRRWFKEKQNLTAVDAVSFDLYPGETLGLVGESGCGKSTISRALVNLDPPTAGDIRYKGRSVIGLKAKALRELRQQIQLVFQDPFAALHPLKSIGKAIAEPLYVHGLVSGKTAQKERVIKLLDQVGLAEEYYHRYPHQLSGGQRQRVVIARALATEPQLLLLDESVAALDISVQAQVLNLLNDLKEQRQLSYLFISHDLNVVKYMADRILVMQKGILVEEAEADELYFHPQQPYTQELIAALPKI
ncbi:MAG: ABC transporter ATP-binding protein [Flavobacteriaceae bacterium TMED42]|nr:MAG: ABC transporter ATP-binding protein [Flavobacteriaceae bacterium TMED42]|tara:strand:+ start:8289 stop:9968 length:1680 start_codon:yes stop_codon:yes gene_type:complete